MLVSNTPDGENFETKPSLPPLKVIYVTGLTLPAVTTERVRVPSSTPVPILADAPTILANI